MRHCYYILLLLLTLVINSTTSKITKKKSSAGFNHLSGCTPVPVEVKYPGCSKIFTFGCAGYCKSGGSLAIKGQSLLPKWTCCKPKKVVKFKAELKCSGIIKDRDILAAFSCECQLCSPLHQKNNENQ